MSKYVIYDRITERYLVDRGAEYDGWHIDIDRALLMELDDASAQLADALIRYYGTGRTRFQIRRVKEETSLDTVDCEVEAKSAIWEGRCRIHVIISGPAKRPGEIDMDSFRVVYSRHRQSTQRKVVE
jgi:hypothetical protein